MTLTIPPLRERTADIPALVRAFVAESCQTKKRRLPRFSEEAMGILCRHSWPGNVRELRNVVERALLLCNTDEITRAHLPETMLVPPQIVIAQAPAGPTLNERDRIVAALAECADNQSRAARKLGLSRKRLISRLEAYGLARPKKGTSR
jgi:DNA-binding NtrC family response regulator